MTAYHYERTEAQLWTVVAYGADGSRHTDSDHDTKEDAAERVHYLNGGGGCVELARQLYAVVLDFMPNVGQCTLQDYGRLNDALVAAERRFGTKAEGGGA